MIIIEIQVSEVIRSVNFVLPDRNSIEIELYGLVSSTHVCVVASPSNVVTIAVIQVSIYLIVPGSYYIYADLDR